MTPPALDAGVIRQKLDAIEGSLSTLESLGEVTSARLAGDPWWAPLWSGSCQGSSTSPSRSTATSSPPSPDVVPASIRSRSGWRRKPEFDADMAAELVGSVGMRNVIVHQYIQLDLEIIAAAVPKAIEQYRSYVSAVAAFVVDLEGDRGRNR
jgi:Protein of unknown function DUF86